VNGRHRGTGTGISSGAPPERARELVRTAGALMTTTVVSSALGVVFWVVAARLLPAGDVGRDATLVTVMQTVGAIADLNLNATLPRLLPAARRRVRMVTVSYLLTGGLALIAGMAVVGVGPAVSGSLRFVSADPDVLFVLPLATAAWTVFALQDSVLATIGKAGWVPLENTIFGVAKIILLVILERAGVPHAVFLAWVLPMVALTLPVNGWLLRTGLGTQAGDDRPAAGTAPTGRGLLSFLAWDYGALLAAQAGVLLLPIIVLVRSGASAAAAFSVAFTAAMATDALFLSVGLSLTVQGASRPDAIRPLARTAVRRFGPLLATGVAVGAIAAPVLLTPFGHLYVEKGTGALRLLLIAAIPQGVLSLRMALWRLDGRTGLGAAAAVCSSALLAAGLAVLLGPLGPTGAGLAWLIAQLVPAAVVLPSLVTRISEPRSLPSVPEQPSVPERRRAPDRREGLGEDFEVRL
jgi:O-antigen/teichoic acid export membrane protein